MKEQGATKKKSQHSEPIIGEPNQVKCLKYPTIIKLNKMLNICSVYHSTQYYLRMYLDQLSN